MRWVGALFAALGVGGVAGAILNPDAQRGTLNRGAQVAADVGGEGFQRRDVEGVQAGGRGCAKFSQGGQEASEGFAATSGRDEQRGGVGCAGQHVKLVGVQVPAFGAEPVNESGGEGEHGVKIGCETGEGKAFCLPLRVCPPIPNLMKILFLGDVMGRSGRAAVTERLPGLRAEWGLDFVVVNGENASSGLGLTPEHARGLLDAGADCVTLGDHAFDQKDMLQFIETEPRVIRPLNYAKAAPGKGARVFAATQGRKVLVAQALGQVFMKRPFDDPFSAVETVLKTYPLGGVVQAALVDMHCEATSEKMAMGHWCDGRASLVVGTHTHVPTADAQILAGGCAYLTDAGMCGDYDSVIGMEKLEPMRRFITGMPKARFEPANGPATLSGVYVETDDKTGRATRVAMIRIGGRLQEARP